MSRKKHYYYVLVFTNSGPKFVTKTNNMTRDAYWNLEDKPLAFSKDDAEFMAVALTWNGNYAVTVVSTYEIEGHPYNYEKYKIEWTERNGDE